MSSRKPSRIMTLAIQRFDRTNALHTGSVTIDSMMITHLPPMTCSMGLINGTFDAAEMPLAYYLFLHDQGTPLIAIPLFPDRIFVREYVYTRPDTGIISLKDLRGRHVGIPRYYITASLWHRGILKDDYGIRPHEIEWHTTSPEIDPRMNIPQDVRVVVSPGSYLGIDRLLDGTVDCLMTEATPLIPHDKLGNVVQILEGDHEPKQAYVHKLGFHSIVHVIVIKKDAIKERPQLPQELCDSFDKAKQSAYQLLQNERTTSLPLMRSYLNETIELFGLDPWPYGISGRNRSELEMLLGYAYDQGMTRRKLDLDTIFEPSVRKYPFSAEMISGANLGALESLVGHLPKEDSKA